MRQLADAEIADMARRVGFADPDLHTAIASAIASSNGYPAYEHAIYPGPVAVYKGLYGVDLCEWPALVGVDLADPWRATEAAYDLTGECSGFDWCPAFRAGTHAHHLGRAGVASSMLPGPAKTLHPITARTARQQVERAVGRIAHVRDAIGDHAIRGR